ncbi:MAG: HAD family hydrolase [Vicinamibacterales bacterium]
MTPAVFLDRDGTMIREAHYLSRREDLHWFPATIDMIRLLNRAGYLVFVTTNQGGIGLGLYDETFVVETHQEMDATIRAGGGHVDGWFYCPHHPNAVIDDLRLDCECRKPRTGMIERARAAHAIDLARSFVVGDKLNDVRMAEAVGATGILVRTGHGADIAERQRDALPAGTRIASDLAEATMWMIDAREATR